MMLTVYLVIYDASKARLGKLVGSSKFWEYQNIFLLVKIIFRRNPKVTKWVMEQIYD